MPNELNQDEINKLLSRILRGSKRVERSSDDWMVPVGMPYFKGPGDSGEGQVPGSGVALRDLSGGVRL